MQQRHADPWGRHYVSHIMQHRFISKDLTGYIYPRIMTEVNVSATVGMSATVGNVRNSGENVHNSGGNIHNSENDLGNLWSFVEWRLSFTTVHRLPLKIH